MISDPAPRPLVFVESTYRPGHRQGMHSHVYANVSVVLAGTMGERVGSRSHEGAAGHLVFKPAGIPHGNRCGSKGARMFRIEFHDGWLDDSYGFRPSDEYGWIPGGPALALMLRARQEHEEPGSDVALALECLALEILELMPGSPSIGPKDGARDMRGPEPSWFRTLRDLLHTRCGEPLRVSDLAREIGVHPVYMARVFRRRYRGTIGDYTRWLRVGRSIEAMREKTAPLAEVALEAGFYDQAHFTKAFRKAIGKPPAEFRREI